jgi:hypothetical protein
MPWHAVLVKVRGEFLIMATGGDRKRNGGGADKMGGNEINWPKLEREEH